MGRPTLIDRNKVLDAAETLVRCEGLASITIGAVAKAAGISKGGVQSCLGSKEQLIGAMFERWSDELDQEVTAIAGENATPISRLRAHIQATRRTDDAQADRAAGLMTAMLNAKKYRPLSDQWYRERMDLMDTATDQGRRARLAFLATEGLFMLRCFGVLTVPESEWDEIFDDIERVIA